MQRIWTIRARTYSISTTISLFFSSISLAVSLFCWFCFASTDCVHTHTQGKIVKCKFNFETLSTSNQDTHTHFLCVLFSLLFAFCLFVMTLFVSTSSQTEKLIVLKQKNLKISVNFKIYRNAHNISCSTLGNCFAEYSTIFTYIFAIFFSYVFIIRNTCYVTSRGKKTVCEIWSIFVNCSDCFVILPVCALIFE